MPVERHQKGPSAEHVSCALCGQERTFTGDDATELAQIWLEDGGHYCIDILGDDE